MGAIFELIADPALSAEDPAAAMEALRTHGNTLGGGQMKIIRRTATLALVGLMASALPAPAAPAHLPVELTAGFSVERQLDSPVEHVYTAKLENGAALIASVSQKSVDVAIYIYGPNGARADQIDGGEVGESELIRLTAHQAGIYRVVVRAFSKEAQSGRYVLRVDAILSLAENAKRMARLAYPVPAIYDLWEASLVDPAAVDAFEARHKGKPIVEEIPGDGTGMLVTYYCVADADTDYVLFNGGPDALGMRGVRLGTTNFFFVTQQVPRDARFSYGFNLFKVHRAGPNGEIESREVVYGEASVLTMPEAPPQPYVVERSDVSRGAVVPAALNSTFLNEMRKLTVYTPADFDPTSDYDLLIVFDGERYSSAPGRDEEGIPTPTILNNLLSEKKIRPTIAIMVGSMGQRDRDLKGSSAFASFVADELVPWARKTYPIRPGAGSVVAAGSSFGGFTASYVAIKHSDVIGNVLSQSGSYWLKGGIEENNALYPRDAGMLLDAFRQSQHLPIRFYLDVGLYDLGAAMLGTNRQLSEILKLKGYDVDYREFIGGHSSVNWRGTLADGLISLLGNE